MTASINAVRATGWMTRPTQVNGRGHRHTRRAKGADRLWPKSAMQSVAPSDAWSTRTIQTAGVQAGTNSPVSLIPKLDKPDTPPRPQGWGRRVRKERCGGSGQRDTEKSEGRPVMGRIGVALSLRRESGQTSSGSCMTREQAEPSQGKWQMNAGQTACASSSHNGQ